MKRLFCILLLTGFWLQVKSQQQESFLQFSTIESLIPAAGADTTYGLGGPLVGVHKGVLILAGGTNFPDAAPWKGGTKTLRSDSYLLQENAGKYSWQLGPKLPHAVAYGQSASTPQGVFHAGGTDEEGWSDQAFMLSWTGDSLIRKELPPMPFPLAYGSATYLNGKVYLAGGFEAVGKPSSDAFLTFDLDNQAWEILPSWPGPGRILPSITSQNEGDETVIYLSGGRLIDSLGKLSHLSDHFAFYPKAKQWVKKADMPLALAGAFSAPMGTHHLMLCGGDDGSRTFQVVALSKQLADLKSAGGTKQFVVDSLQTALNAFWEGYTDGFSNRIFYYHTITDSWVEGSPATLPIPLTTQMVAWGNEWLIPSGEIRPGIRTSQILKISREKLSPSLHGLDYVFLGIYLFLLVLMGFYFAQKGGSTEDFFKASGRIPPWAAGLSILGTSLSAITFMAVPAKTYATDWLYFVSSFAQLLVVPIVAALIIPYLRRQHVTTAYEYLETRFNLAIRLLGGAAFLLFQFGRIGIVLFLPAMPLALVTGIDIYTCIVIVAGLSILYTILGGIEAVIWTDVLQVFVLVGGAIFCLIWIAIDTPGGFSALIETSWADGKLDTWDFDFSFDTPSFWVVLGGGMAINLISQSSDQAMVQRYLTTKDEKGAVRSLWIFGLTAVPVIFLFYFLGTALYVFFQNQPETLAPYMEQADAILPWFIVTQLPVGVAGLLVAGIFAASMSSLDSSLNSVATVLTSDFYRRFRPGKSDKRYLAFARWMTLIVGIAGMSFALLMASFDIKSLWDEFSKILGLFAGGLAGLFFLGMTQKRANSRGALIGFFASAIMQYVISQYTDIHFLLYSFTGLVSCYVIGFFASLFSGQD